jgi:hypothetical protein
MNSLTNNSTLEMVGGDIAASNSVEFSVLKGNW